MAIELVLEQTHASGQLLPARLTLGFAQIAKASATAPRGVLHGQELRFGLALSPDDAAAPAFMLDFIGQGRRVKGGAHGPSAALLTWGFHALAGALACTLLDAESGEPIAVAPDALRAAAAGYLEVYEKDVRSARRSGADASGATFLAWLAREELVAPGADGGAVDALGAVLPMDDAVAAYELLLESAAIDDVFVSEREFAGLLARFRARLVPSE